jgi:hypothetical protein
MASNYEAGESSHNAIDRALEEAAFNMASLRKAQPSASTALPILRH